MRIKKFIKNIIFYVFLLSLSFLNINPNIHFNEKLAIDDELTNIKARSLDYNLKLDLETTVFGLLPLNMRKLSAIHHTMTPFLSFIMKMVKK